MENMTIGELKEILSEYKDDDEVVFDIANGWGEWGVEHVETFKLNKGINICCMIKDSDEVSDWEKKSNFIEELSMVNINDKKGNLASFLIRGSATEEHITSIVKKERDSHFREKLLVLNNPEDYDVSTFPSEQELFDHLYCGVEGNLEDSLKLTSGKIYSYFWDFEGFVEDEKNKKLKE